MPKIFSRDRDVPYFEPELLKGMEDYWKTQLHHNSELAEKVLAACMEIPDFAPIIRSIPKDLMEENNKKSIERSRRAFEEGDWKPYFDNLRSEGERYAMSGVTFGAWIDLLRRYKAIVEPHIAADFSTEPARALKAQSAMHELMYIAVEVIGDAYVTARQQVIEGQKDQLKESNLVLEQFAIAASHDLKSPLRAIANLADWIEEDIGGEPKPELKEHLDLMRQRIRRMGNLMDGLLGYSRAGQVHLEQVEVDLGAMAKEVVDSLAPPAGISVTIAGRLPVFKAPEMPLRQVLSNLVSNAIKHHHGDGYVKISARDLGSSVEIDVEDDGPGIEARYHERIFEMFQTLRPKDEVEGSGIGLALVKRTLTRHGATIWLRSEPGKGSLFRVTWPKGT